MQVQVSVSHNKKFIDKGVSMVKLTIDGQPVEVPEGTTVLEAAEKINIRIPKLCHHPAVTPYGSCRLCVVEVEGFRTIQASCTLPAGNGMVVRTNTPALQESRQFVLSMLFSERNHFCPFCQVSGGDCELQNSAYDEGMTHWPIQPQWLNFPVDTSHPYYVLDNNRCILCRRCVRACQNINGVEAISVFYRGFNAYIGFGADSTMQDSPCEFCGSCVAVCPTAALWPKMSIGKGRPWQVKTVDTICSYCGVGCKLTLHVKDNEIVRVEGASDGPANRGWTCVKGRFGYDYVHHPDRVLKPKVRRYLLDGQKKSREGAAWEWVETNWDTALAITARRLGDIRAGHGPGSIGVLTSAKCLNEENYLMNKFARQVIGTNSIDHCARL